MGKLEHPWKTNPKYGFCERLGRNHCPADKRGTNPGWCTHCQKDWVEK